MRKKAFLLMLLAFLGIGMASAQVSRVTGVVIDEEDEPIVGASVLVKGTSVGTITNVNGEFVLNNLPSTAKTLVVSYVGMETQEVAIKPSVRVVLSYDSNQLEEVVITVAYGTAKKTSLTGAISSVKQEDIKLRPTSSVTSALEGTTSGVQVNSTYGQPGDSPSIYIRGYGTVNGSSSPLYVIDGVAFGGNISDLNPADIESISVLKDAASCALYGNRAANGVILITTKQGGGSEKLSVDVTVNMGTYSRGIKEYKTTNPRQFMNASWQNMKNYYVSAGTYTEDEAAAYASSSLISDVLLLNIFDKEDNALFDSNGELVSDAKILDGYKDDLDWFDQAQRAGFRQEYIVSGTGSGEKMNAYFSLGYLDEKGYVKNSSFNRLTARGSVTLTPKKWLKVGLNVYGSHQSANTTNGDSSSAYSNIFMYARNIAPIYPVHIHNVEDGSYRLDANGDKQYDPGYYTNDDGETVNTRNQYVDRHALWEAELDKDHSYRNTLQGTAFADIKFLKDFTFSVKGNMSVRNSENQTYNNATIGDGAGNNGRASRTYYRYKNYTLMEQLTWNHQFDKHNVDVLLGHENYYYNYSYGYAYKTDETFAGKTYMSNFNTITSVYGYDNNYRTESYLGRIRYNYDDRYNVEASFRRDGSSRFSSDARWGNFGSIGANWLISREEFMQDVNWVNNLKLRANWGQVGSDSGAGYYAYMALYYGSTNANAGAYYISQLSNYDLKWETGESWSVAVEARLFNRWNIEVEYFDKRNKDLLFDVYNPLSAGATSTSSAESTVTQNLGTISNRGVEINTDVDIFKNRDWKVNFAVNAAFIKNKVTKLPEQNKDGIISGIYKILEGKSRYEVFTYHYAGVDQMTGRSLYSDLNLDDYYITLDDGSTLGDGSTEISSDNYVLINGEYYALNTTYANKSYHGTTMPTVYGSFKATISWKQLTLSALFTYSLGGKIYDGVYAGLMATSTTPSNYHQDILKGWTGVPDGMTESSADRIDANGIPQINSYYSSYNNATSDRWLTSRDYLVFKNLNLSYQLPRKWVKAIDMQAIGISITCENLFTLTARRGMNPQVSTGGYQYNYLVTPRVFSIGLNAKF